MDNFLKAIHKDRSIVLDFCKSFSEIYLYGAGMVGEYFYDYLIEENIFPKGVIVSKNADKINFHKLPVYNFSDFTVSKNIGIILSVNFQIQKEIIPEIEKRKLLNQCFVQNIVNYFPDNDIDTSFILSTPILATKSYFKNFNELDAIGKRTNTDKSSEFHNYLKKYEFFFNKFKNDNIKFLELGVYKGSSIKMWKEYFNKSYIIGVDINPDCQKFTDERTKIITANLSKINDINKLKDIRPTIILDDASHIWSHQLKCLFILFPTLVHGGLYILEDLETSFKSYKNRGFDDTEISTYYILSAINEVLTSKEKLITSNKHPIMSTIATEIENLAIQIEMMSFMHGSVIIVKK